MIFANRASGILYRFIRQNGGCYLLPANVCPVVPLTFQLAEVGFEFVDINNDTLCIDEERCLSLAGTGLFQGIVFVHTYGTSYDPQPFFKQLKVCAPSFHIVDDKCLCVPVFSAHETEADLTLFSTGYAKYVDLGRGGFGFLQPSLDLSMEPLGFDGSEIDSVYKKAFVKKEKIGYVPSRWLDAYVTDCCDEKYRQCVEREAERMREYKQEINAIYREVLGEKALPDVFNQWRYNLLVKDKEAVMKRLFDSGLFASSHYQPASRLFVDEVFPNAERLYGLVVNLFNDKYITKEQAIKVARLVF